MWKINNITNKRILDKFKEDIILPLFDAIIEMSQNKTGIISDRDAIKHSRVYISLTQPQKDVFNFMFGSTYRAKGRVGNIYRFYELINDLVNNYSTRSLKFYRKTFYSQNMQADAGCLSIIRTAICDELKTIFSKFFYESFFDKDEIWVNIIGSSYNRKAFHTFFEQDNKNLSICPYCDIDSIIDKDNRKVEHFLPRDKYPFLAMCAMNLISACGACNTQKSTVAYKLIANPYNEQVSNNFKFSLDTSKIAVDIVTNNPSKHHNNYLSLFKLKKRYEEESIYNYIRSELDIFFDSFTGEEVSESDIKHYFKTNAKRKSLMLATKDVILEEYEEYKKL